MKYHFHTSCYDYAFIQEMLGLNRNTKYPSVVEQVLWVKFRKSWAEQLTEQPDACKAFQLHVHDQYTIGLS
jgi:hypothetical protein